MFSTESCGAASLISSIFILGTTTGTLLTWQIPRLSSALGWSRGVLRDFGNMSSATLMFILRRILDGFQPAPGGGGDGFAVAFGPGLAAESFRFQVLT